MDNFIWVILLIVVFSSMATAKEVIPKVGVYITQEDILQARELAKTKPFAKAEKNRILAVADRWVNVEDDYIRSIIPKPGSIFSYGIAGCPEHNQSWSNFGGAGICSLDRPLVLRCPGGHEIDFDNPDSKFYDSGNGVYIDGRRFFFRGVWNAYVVNTFTGWGSEDGVLHYLAYAYALTGEDRYAQKAAVIFDALAHLSPTTKGPRDFHPNDDAIAGRIHFLTSIVHRSKVHFVRSFDLLYNNPAMHSKSFYTEKTIAENVAEGLLLDYMFVEFDLRDGKLSTLHNHESDELRAMLATGIVLGIPEYITWGLQGATYFFENTIDKDGLYYEGSPSYANFTQRVFSDIAELAYNYDPNNYDLEGLPEKVNFYDHPKLREFLFSLRDKYDIAGHYPSFGNASTDTRKIQIASRDLGRDEFLYLDQLYHRTEIPELKERYREKMLEFTQGNPDKFRSGTWALFHVEPEEYSEQTQFRKLDQAHTNYFSGPSLAILGSGEGVDRRGLLIRGGPNLPHSHDDSLALYYYDKGLLLTQDNGYYIFGSPLHYGWGSQAASHNLVVIDNDKYRYGWYKSGPGADLLGFADLSGLKYVYLNNPHQFPRFIEEYSRLTALIDINDKESYVFDVFTVDGGKRHDYMFHTGAPIMETDVEFQNIPDVWTLAGLDDKDAPYNVIGQSYGERIISGDMIRDLGIASEGVKSMYWNPPPGNGYGFIYDLKEALLTEKMFEASFKYYDGLDTTLTNRLFFDQDTTIYKGLGPNLSGTEKYPYIILRSEADKDHQSRVISIMDASLGLSSIAEVKRFDENSFVVEFFNGDSHFILLNSGKAKTPAGEFVSKAQFAIAKFNQQELANIAIVGHGEVKLNDIVVTANQFQTKILEVNYEKSQVIVDGLLDLEVGDLVAIDNDDYKRNTVYRVSSVAKKEDKTVLDLEGSMVIAKGTVAKGTKYVDLNTPLPRGFSYDKSTQYLDGKLFVREKTNESEIIKRTNGFKNVYLAGDINFEPQDSFVIYDIKVGDTLSNLPTAIWEK